MNKENRKQLDSARADLERAQESLEIAQEIIESIKNDEQSKFDNMPEGLQDGEIEQAIQQAIDELDNALSEIGNFDCGSVIEYIESAAQ